MVKDVREEDLPNGKHYKRIVLTVQKREVPVLAAAVKAFEKKCQERARALMVASAKVLDSIFAPEDIIPETIKESLIRADFKGTNDIIKSCNEKVDKLEKSGELKELGVTEDEAYTIIAYAYQAKEAENSPYRVLNQALQKRDLKRLKTLRGFILNLLSVLRKFKKYKGDCLYRGIDGKWLEGDQSNFKKGDVLVLTPFTSTSTDKDVALSFIDGSSTEVEEPILYEMHGDFQGYSITKLSKLESNKGNPIITSTSLSNISIMLF